MSKFTKALEKIQNDKLENPVSPDKKQSSYGLPKELEEPVRHWDKGVPSVKNAKPETCIVTYHFPNSLITEQYRMLRTNLKTQLEKDKAKVVLISSSVHGEGKTVTATNLAISLAEAEDCKVALIDADLRRGRVTEYLGLGKNLKGLSELLAQNLSFKQLMVKNSLPNLLILPKGKTVKNPSELVESQKFRVLVAELRNHFDYILIDAPPIMSVADVSILARETDGLLMVVRSGRTPKNVISQAHHLFEQAGVKILGYVLTGVEYQSADARYYYHQYYSNQVDKKKQFKTRVEHYLKKTGEKFQKAEEKFNQWWEKTVLKK